jgi:hypothetical protein
VQRGLNNVFSYDLVPSTEIVEVRPRGRAHRGRTHTPCARSACLFMYLCSLQGGPTVRLTQAALRATRRVNDFPTAVRVIEGVKNKLQNDKVYAQYLADLKPTIEELGITDHHGRAL